MLPAALAVSVLTKQVPPIFNVPVELLVRVLAPASAVPTVNVPLFVVVPLIVTLGIVFVVVPPIVWVVPLKVWTPVLAV